MSKQAKVFIEHILESIRLIQTYTGQLSKDDFLASPQVQDAVTRRLEIIGEAVKHLPSELRERHARCLGVKSPECGTCLFIAILAWIWN